MKVHMPVAAATSSSEASVRRRHRIINFVQVAGFLMFLVVPLLRLGQGDVTGTIAKTERRRPSPFPVHELFSFERPPDAGGSGWLNFPKAFESWFNDHLGMRHTFIRIYNFARIAKVSGPTPADFSSSDTGPAAQMRVVIGRNGWLFYGGGRMIDDFRRTSPFSARQLSDWCDVLRARRDWLARRGIRYVLMIAPNQQTVYPEQMPRSIVPVGAVSRLDQLKARLSRDHDFIFVDPRDRLISGKRQFPTYHKTDTHWNDFGSFVAYTQLCEQMAIWFPGLRPAPLNDFCVSVSDAEGRHLAAAVDSFVCFREELVTLSPKRARRALHVKLPPTSESEHHALSRNEDAELDCAVVLHDSFFESVRPYFDEHWKRVRSVWTDDFPIEVIEAERPQVVVQELVERKLLFVEMRNPPAIDQPQEVVADRGPQQASSNR
jgi:alginate O-acetyltransferase complex protein AlgJ